MDAELLGSSDTTTVEISDAPWPPAPPAGDLTRLENVAHDNTFDDIGKDHQRLMAAALISVRPRAVVGGKVQGRETTARS